ncbi:hypothetical protein JGU66_22355 [Myxococcaceae bacterium JPH2]|nr:hypothetical protein [Myxococcaceae bacterium JPH2]
MTTRALALMCLMLSACSAEIEVQTDPINQSVPVTSLLAPVYAEVAIDLPEETRSVDVTVNAVSSTLTVVNPTQTLTLRLGARLSFTGKATPTEPVLYTDINRPAYFDQATVLLPTRDFAANTRTPLTLESPALAQALGKPRVWLILDNTVARAGGLPLEPLPVNVQLQDIVFHATVTKQFPGLGGALEVGGL